MRLSAISENDFRLRELVPAAPTPAPGAMLGAPPTAAPGAAPAVQQDPQAAAKMQAQQALDRANQKKQIQDQIKQTQAQLVNLQKQLAGIQ